MFERCDHLGLQNEMHLCQIVLEYKCVQNTTFLNVCANELVLYYGCVYVYVCKCV